MNDFLSAAFPWIIMGISLAVFFVTMNQNKEKGESADNYGLLGMCMGLCFGLAIGTALKHSTLGMAPGMLFGYAIGSGFKKPQ